MLLRSTPWLATVCLLGCLLACQQAPPDDIPPVALTSSTSSPSPSQKRGFEELMQQYGIACRSQDKIAWLATIHPISLKAMQGEYSFILEDSQQRDFDSFVDSMGWEERAAPANFPEKFTVQPTLLASHRRGTKEVWTTRWLAPANGSLYLVLPEPTHQQAKEARSSIKSREQSLAEAQKFQLLLSPELKQTIVDARKGNQVILAIKAIRNSHPKIGLKAAQSLVYSVWRSQP